MLPLRRRDLREARRTAIAALTLTLSVVEQALSDIPVPGASAAVGAVGEVIRGIAKAARNVETMTELNERLMLLYKSVLEPLSNTPHLDTSMDLRDRVSELIRELHTISMEWRQKASQGFFRRLLHSNDDEGDLQRSSQRIQDAIVRFQLAGGIRQEQAINRVENQVQRVEEHVSAHVVDDLIRSLPRAKKASHRSRGNETGGGCLKDTRTQVLKDIQEWVDSRDAPRMFWLNGMAGTGKSTIAETVAQTAHDNGIPVASFFLSRRGDANLRDASVVFPTLAYQLSLLDRTLMHHIVEALQADPDVAEQVLQQQLRKLILLPLQRCDHITKPVLLILDAVDECEERGAKEVLQLLVAAIPRLQFQLKVFVTSRPEPHIRAIFGRPDAAEKIVILHDIEASIVQGDIRLYLRSRLTDIPNRMPEFAAYMAQVTEAELDGLVKRAGKLFIYAATAARFIENEDVGDPQGQLQILLGKQTVSDARPYAQLDDLFLEVLRAATSDVRRFDIYERFRTVVGTIVLLQDPLPIAALERLVGLRRGDARIALNKLHSLIISPPNDNEPAVVYHPSFSDFIADSSRCTDPTFLVNKYSHHQWIALRCLKLMMNSLKKDMLGVLHSEHFNADVADLEERVKANVPAELQYACLYWASHLSRATLGSPELVTMLQDFIARCLLWWLEILSLLRHLPRAVTCLNEARSWATMSACPRPLLASLNDAHRFALGEFGIISSSARHMYQSAVPFTPYETTVYQTYKHEAQHAVRVLQGADAQWSPCLGIWSGHKRVVQCVVVSPDGGRIASGSDDNTVRVWDAVTGGTAAILEGHSAGVCSVAFSKDSSQLLSGSLDSTVRVWSVVTGEMVIILEGHSSSVYSVSFSPIAYYAASGSSDTTIRIWNVETGETIQVLKGHENSVRSVAFSPDGTRLVSGAWDNTVRLWNMATGENAAVLEGHFGSVYAVSVSPEGSLYASGSLDHSIRIWDARTTKTVSKLQGHTDSVWSLDFSPDGSQLASGARDNTIRFWNVKTGDTIRVLTGHSNSVSSVAYTPDGYRLLSGSLDTTVRLWDAVPAETVAVRAGHSRMVRYTRFSPNGHWLVSSSWDCSVLLWDALTGKVAVVIEGQGSAHCVAFSYDSHRLASGSEDGTIRVWEAATGKVSAVMEGQGSVYCIAFSPDGSRVASGSSDETVRLWDGSTGRSLAVLQGHSDPVSSVVFSPGGDRIASAGSDDNIIRVWDGRTGAPTAILEGHTDVIHTVVFSPDGSCVASGSDDQTVRLWDPMTGDTLRVLEGHSDMVHDVDFSTDGLRLTSRSGEEVYNWIVASGQRVQGRSVGRRDSSQPLEFVWNEDGWLYAQGAVCATRVCRIPASFGSTLQSPSTTATHGERVAIGTENGSIIILDISGISV